MEDRKWEILLQHLRKQGQEMKKRPETLSKSTLWLPSPPNFPSVLATFNLFQPGIDLGNKLLLRLQTRTPPFPLKGIFMSAISIGGPAVGEAIEDITPTKPTLHPLYDR